MNNNSFLKKIGDWLIAMFKNIQEQITHIYKVWKNKKTSSASSKASNPGNFWWIWFLRLRLGLQLLLILTAIILLVFLTINLKKCSGGKEWELDTIEKSSSFVIVEIKKISEFSTATYYEELLIEKKKDVPRLFGLYSSTELLAVVVKGTIKVGFELSSLTERDISIGKDGVLIVKLPKAKILSSIINPSDTDIVYGGNNNIFNDADFKDVINQAKIELEDHAREEGVFEKATDQGKKEITNLFVALGFDRDKIIVSIE